MRMGVNDAEGRQGEVIRGSLTSWMGSGKKEGQEERQKREKNSPKEKKRELLR